MVHSDSDLAVDRDADRAGRASASLPAMTDAIDRKHPGDVKPTDEDLPVVARLVIEIRSDGSRTVARGGLEDTNLGERVAIEARGNSPAELAGQLLRSILAAPFQAALTRMTGAQRHALPDGPERAGLVERVRRSAARAVRRGLRLP